MKLSGRETVRINGRSYSVDENGDVSMPRRTRGVYPPTVSPFETLCDDLRNAKSHEASVALDASIFVRDTLAGAHSIACDLFGANPPLDVVLDIYDRLIGRMALLVRAGDEEVGP